MKTTLRLIAFSTTIFAVVVVWMTWLDPTKAAQSPASSRPEKALIDDFVLANRMLTSEEISFLDAFGTVSVRSRSAPTHFYMAHSASPGLVTVNDIIEMDLDGKPVSGEGSGLDEERYIHSEIYKARSDVMAVVHSQTPELAAFGVSSVPLRTEDSIVPVFDVRNFTNERGGTISTAVLARSLAQSLGNRNAILLRGDGAVVAAPSIYELVGRASGLRRCEAPTTIDRSRWSVGFQSTEGGTERTASRHADAAHGPHGNRRRHGAGTNLGVLETSRNAADHRPRQVVACGPRGTAGRRFESSDHR